MTGLTERQLDWLRQLFQKQALERSSTDAAERNTKPNLKNPGHPDWQEYDSLQSLASHTTDSKASRV